MAKKASSTIGNLRHQVTVQSISNTADGQGGYATTWADFATRWAYLSPTSSFEKLFADRLEYTRTHTCVMRYDATITSAMRIYFNLRYFQIKGIRFADERKFFMLLDLEEGPAT